MAKEKEELMNLMNNQIPNSSNIRVKPLKKILTGIIKLITQGGGVWNFKQ